MQRGGTQTLQMGRRKRGGLGERVDEGELELGEGREGTARRVVSVETSNSVETSMSQSKSFMRFCVKRGKEGKVLRD